MSAPDVQAARAALAAALANGSHPITLFVLAAASMLVSDPRGLDVLETRAGRAHDFLLVEILPPDGDFGKVLGAGGEILDAVRMVAKRMAQRDQLTVEIKLREPRR